jgi:hypothetical protein
MVDRCRVTNWVTIAAYNGGLNFQLTRLFELGGGQPRSQGICKAVEGDSQGPCPASVVGPPGPGPARTPTKFEEP